MSSKHPDALSDQEREEVTFLMRTQPMDVIQPLAKAYLMAWTPKDERQVRIELIKLRRQESRRGAT